MTEPALIYVADVMCSWCWGFAPTVERLQRELGLKVTIVNGGLRPGDSAEALSPRMSTFLAGCWTDVGKASGQPFDMAGLDRSPSWRYDTEPPAQAVATLREQAPEHALTLFHRMQEAFYAHAVDIVDPGTWAPLLQGLVQDVPEFIERASGEHGRKLAWQDFAQARRWGISGFPCLLIDDDGELGLVTKGWAPGDTVVHGIQGWLDSRAAPVADGAACAIDGAGC